MIMATNKWTLNSDELLILAEEIEELLVSEGHTLLETRAGAVGAQMNGTRIRQGSTRGAG